MARACIYFVLLILVVPIIGFSQAVLNPPKREFRAVWVSTAYNLDWPSSAKLTTEEQKAEFIQVLDSLEKDHINAVIVQVRAAGDAFYKSKSEPWSSWLTGEQGKAPDPFYDPLTFMIEKCHERNIEFHAWFNLFRAVSHTKFSPPVKDHVSVVHPDWVYTVKTKKMFDPGVPAVRSYLTGVIAEVVNHYEVDGIHLDDYFYWQEKKGEVINDQQTWQEFKGGFTDKGDWRRNNINTLIKSISDTIKSLDPYVKFGISPFPIWRHDTEDSAGSATRKSVSCYDEYYADSRKWMKEGWVDYMAPQLYWGTNHPNVNYNVLLNWWKNNTYDRHLYIGHAYYRIPTVWKSSNELVLQLNATRVLKEVQGNAFFRWATYKENLLGAKDSLRNQFYQFPALVPVMSWIDSLPPDPPTELEIIENGQGFTLSWSAPVTNKAHYFVVYRFSQHDKVSLKDPSKIIGLSRETSFRDETVRKGTDYVYIITSCDRGNNESTHFLGAWTHYEGSP